MTQTDLAGAMDVTPSTVTGWETGKSSPHFQVLLRLRDHFQVDLERLVYHDLQKENARDVPESGTNLKNMELFEQLKGRLDALEKRVERMEEK